jgi:REP element-mobilizing transposase RayT
MLRSGQDATRTVRGDSGAELPEFNGQDDHGHLLAGYPPKAAVPALVNSLKGVRRGGYGRSSPAR